MPTSRLPPAEDTVASRAPTLAEPATRPSVHRVAVIGAGLAGLACARRLADHDVEVTLFDKGRSVGGRLATRRVATHTFDLGAQYFTARDPRFVQQVRAWLDEGVCAPWQGRIAAIDGRGGAAAKVEPIVRFVGTPRMTTLAHHLASGLDAKAGHRVERIARVDGRLWLWGTVAAAGVSLGPAVVATPPGELTLFGGFDAVVVCVPADQAGALLDPVSAALAREARAVTLEPCFALGLVAGDEDADLRALPHDGVFIGREGSESGSESASTLAWVARDSSKPGRPAGERWVLHATAAWSRASFELPHETVKAAMVNELARLFGLAHRSPELTTLQRWAHARAATPLDRGALFDDDARVGLGGDWACGGRVEGAYLSGLALASGVLGWRA